MKVFCFTDTDGDTLCFPVNTFQGMIHRIREDGSSYTQVAVCINENEKQFTIKDCPEDILKRLEDASSS